MATRKIIKKREKDVIDLIFGGNLTQCSTYVLRRYAETPGLKKRARAEIKRRQETRESLGYSGKKARLR